MKVIPVLSITWLGPTPLYFTIVRTSVDKKERILAITNIVDKVQEFRIEAKEIGGQKEITCRDILSGKDFESTGGMLSLRLEPYEVLWLKYGFLAHL